MAQELPPCGGRQSSVRQSWHKESGSVPVPLECMNRVLQLSELFGVSTDYLLTGKPVCETDHTAFSNAFLQSLDAAQSLSAARRDRAFSRQELAVLMAAMLMEP